MNTISKGLLFGLIIGLVIGFLGGYTYTSLDASSPPPSSSKNTSRTNCNAEVTQQSNGIAALLGADPSKLPANFDASKCYSVKLNADATIEILGVIPRTFQPNVARVSFSGTIELTYFDENCQESTVSIALNVNDLLVADFEGDGNFVPAGNETLPAHTTVDCTIVLRADIKIGRTEDCDVCANINE